MPTGDVNIVFSESLHIYVNTYCVKNNVNKHILDVKIMLSISIMVLLVKSHLVNHFLEFHHFAYNCTLKI